ncbi:syntaxin-3-like [Takifugu rubripes]|uniref:syntaxin-3-like n=1 Tax=Takifugu rubripes TaxID=31033 RepID=UPI0005D19C92|nr:syntaxin-3-like [Takifugu rubripes]|eukprot:XP_011618412.1 PREDICTED: syntaxin-3-like [Takifugu rubripes]
MEELFMKVGQVRTQLDKLSRHVEEAQKRHVLILSNPVQEQTTKDELDKLEQETRRDVHVIRHQLKVMQTQLPAEDSSVVTRIHRNQLGHMTLCFTDIMKRHHATQTAFREKCKAQIRRQLHIVNEETTDEELEQMLDRDRLAVFMSHMSSSFSTEALNQIHARHRDIVRLESSIKDLQQVFCDVAALLDSQGELINNIEKNVTSAAEYVGQARAEAHKAVTYKKNPTRITSLPNFLKPSKKKPNRAKQNRSELDQN